MKYEVSKCLIILLTSYKYFLIFCDYRYIYKIVLASIRIEVKDNFN